MFAADQATLGWFTLAGTTVTAVFSYLATIHARNAKREASEANTAVNRRPEGSPRLFDMVSETHLKVAELTGKVSANHSHLEGRVGRLEEKLDEVTHALTKAVVKVERMEGEGHGG